MKSQYWPDGDLMCEDAEPVSDDTAWLLNGCDDELEDTLP
jgi:hypothetical protein